MIPLSKPIITENMKKKVLEILDSGRFIKGPVLKEFEEEFAKFCGKKYGIGTCNGTNAIYLALRVLSIKEGDEVLVPSHTFVASASPILYLGAKPIFVDIDENYNIDLNDLQNKITNKTKAIMCVHLYGLMNDMDKLIKIKEKYNLFLIEDAAQAHCAEYKGKRAGSFGDISCFSFFPSKNMTVAGDGGMVLTDNEEIYERLKALREHGQKQRFLYGELSLNFRMSEISAAIGLEQLKYVEEWVEKRRKIAEAYNSNLSNNIIKPIEEENKKHAYHLYVIRTKNRDKLKEYLNDNNIQTGIHYPIPLHKQPIFKEFTCSLPRTEQYVKEILSLPMFPDLEEQQVEFICKKINEFY